MAEGLPLQLSLLELLIENEDRLADNQRMAMPYRTLGKMDETRRKEIQADAARFLASLTTDHKGDQAAKPR